MDKKLFVYIWCSGLDDIGTKKYLLQKNYTITDNYLLYLPSISQEVFGDDNGKKSYLYYVELQSAPKACYT